MSPSPPDAFGQVSRYIDNVILPHKMNQSDAAVESQINNAIDVLYEELYPPIAATALNFDVPSNK